MAEKVEIIVTAKDSASQVLRGISGSFGSIGSAIQQLTAGSGIEALTDFVIKFGKESVDATVAYANEVRNLSMISGQSAEETSRLIQLSDDYKISTSDLTMAVRKLSSDGLTLNVQTLAKLSDEYTKLAPGQERAAFLMDKFGRTGVRFAEIMEKGGASILEMNDSIDENLLLTDQAITQARQYEMAMDSWEEQTMKLQYALGTKLVPALTAVINEANKKIDSGTVFDAKRMIPVYGAWLQLTSIWETAIGLIDQLTPETDSATQSYEAMAKAMASGTPEIQTSTDALAEQEAVLKAEAEAAQVASDKYNTLISLTQSVAGATKDYQTTLSDLGKEREDALAFLADTAPWETSKLNEYKDKLAEIDAKITETADIYKQKMASIAYDNLYAKLSIKGLTDEEYNMAQQAGVALGLWTQQDADLAIAMNDMTTKVVEGKLKVDDLGVAINSLPNGKTIDVIANLIANATGDRTVTVDRQVAGGAAKKANAPAVAMAEGGSFVIPQNYGYEGFNMGGVATASAGETVTVTPRGQQSSGITLIINAQNVIGDSAHLQSYLLPVIRDGLKQVQAGR